MHKIWGEQSELVVRQKLQFHMLLAEALERNPGKPSVPKPQAAQPPKSAHGGETKLIQDMRRHNPKLGTIAPWYRFRNQRYLRRPIFDCITLDLPREGFGCTAALDTPLSLTSFFSFSFCQLPLTSLPSIFEVFRSSSCDNLLCVVY